MLKRRESDIFWGRDWTFIGLVGALMLINVPYLAGVIRPVHDTLYAFNSFYFFYNDFFLNGDFPRWEPFGRYGVQAYYPMLSALSPSSIFTGIVGWCLRIRNVFFLFNLSLFIEQLIFLYGTYLLSRDIFRHRTTVLFVCLSVVLSSVLIYQVWFNFRVYSMLPLILHFVLRFFTTYRLRDLGLAIIVFSVSLMGLVPYMGEVAALELIVIMFVFLAANIRNLGAVLKTPAGDAAQGVVLLISSAVALLAYYYLSMESVKLVENLGFGRDPVSHLVDLPTFLFYGGIVGFIKFLGLVAPTGKYIGDSVTLYIGLIPFVFLVYGLAKKNVLAAVLIAAMSVMGTALIWTTVDLRRTVQRTYATADFTAGFTTGMLALRWLLPLVAIVFVVYVFKKSRNARITAFTAVVAVITLFSIGHHTFVAEALYKYFPMMKYFRHIGHVVGSFKLFLPLLAGFGLESFLSRTEPEDNKSFSVASWGIMACTVISSAIYILVAKRMMPIEVAWLSPLYITLTVFFIVILILARKHMPLRTYFSFILIACVCFQMFGFHVMVDYKNYLLTKKSLILDRKSVRKYDFQNIRTMSPPTSEIAPVEYSIAYNFVQWDPCIPRVKVDYVNSYIADFIRITGGDVRVQTLIPREDSSFNMAVGCIAPKLRLMSDAFFVNSAKESAELMKTAGMEHKLLLSDVPEEVQLSWAQAEPAFGEDTVKIRKFSANELLLEAEVPEGNSAWLYYADSWHPGWKAFINGDPVLIARANHAFKAVMLPGGKSEVRFFFDGGLARYCIYLFLALGTAFTLTALVSMVRVIFRRTKVNGSS